MTLDDAISTLEERIVKLEMVVMAYMSLDLARRGHVVTESDWETARKAAMIVLGKETDGEEAKK